ncbi:MAG: hypothetical protein JJU22_11340 [Gammaproteobacteria bacterium]|nr:hypothetical protein [Gammaproteobacteria bacterium]
MSDWHSEETYKSMIELSQGALKFGAVVNGGAAVALLALVGDLGSADSSMLNIKTAMLCFVAGVASSGLAHACAYLTQLQLYQETAFSASERHTVFLYLAIAFVLGSIGLFSFGAWSAATALFGVEGPANVGTQGAPFYPWLALAGLIFAFLGAAILWSNANPRREVPGATITPWQIYTVSQGDDTDPGETLPHEELQRLADQLEKTFTSMNRLGFALIAMGSLLQGAAVFLSLG